jgi:hypothetical protein
MSITMSGGSGIINNINRYLVQVAAKACLLVRRRSQLEVPVDTGNLIGSAGTDVEQTKTQTIGYIYYEATYAPFVHERLELRHLAGKKAKFLEDPLKASEAEILEILAEGQ